MCIQGETKKEKMKMEINFGNMMNTAVGMGREASGAADVGAGRDASGGRAATRLQASLTITRATPSAEEIAAAAIPDSVLTRDDDLGKLIDAAFNLPPPRMPEFV